MPGAVFISYSHGASLADARELRDALESEIGEGGVFLDERTIPPGSPFPSEIAEGLLGARVILVLASRAYFERQWCVYELQVAIAPYRQGAAGDRALEHVVVALPTHDRVADLVPHLPPPLARGGWPSADDVAGVVEMVTERLATISTTVEERLAGVEDGAVRALRDGGAVPIAADLSAVPGFVDGLPESLGGRLAGRDEELWRLFHVLETQRMRGAARSCAIEGPGGVGKTQLAAEYVWRYGPTHYPGGVVWISAGDEDVAKADVTQGAAAVAGTNGPVLWVIDGIPPPSPGGPAPAIGNLCPIRRRATVLVTTRSGGIKGVDQAIHLDELQPAAGVEMLTSGLADAGADDRAEWESIVRWVGGLPLALRLLNAGLTDRLIRRQDLVRDAGGEEPVDALEAAAAQLAGEVDPAYAAGVAGAFTSTYQGLEADPDLQLAAHCLARLSAAVPVYDESASLLAPGATLGKLAKRGWLQAAASTPDRKGVRWRMHRIVSSFLRSRSPDPDRELVALLEWFRNVYDADLPSRVVHNVGPQLAVASDWVLEHLSGTGGLDAPRYEEALQTFRAIALHRLDDLSWGGHRWAAAGVVRALGAAGDLVARLRERDWEEDDDVAISAASVLSALAGDDAAAALCKELLEDPRELVRYHAMLAAQSLGRPDILAEPGLAAVMSFDKANLRATAVAAYDHLMGTDAPLRTVLSLLYHQASSDDAGRRLTAVEILGRLLAIHGRSWQAGGFTGRHVLGVLCGLALGDPDERVARAAGTGAGAHHDDELLAGLADRLRSASGAGRMRAIDALGWYGAGANRPAIPAGWIEHRDGERHFGVEWPEPKPAAPDVYAPLADLLLDEPEEAECRRALRALSGSGAGKLALTAALGEVFESGRSAEAIRLSTLAYDVVDDFPNALWWRAQALEAAGDWEQALGDYGRMLEEARPVPQVLAARAWVLYQLGRDEAAVDDVDAALAIDPTGDFDESRQPGFHLHVKAGALLRLRDWAGSIEASQAAIALAPDAVRYWYVSAVARNNQGDVEGALADLERALDLDPADAEAAGLRAQLLVF